MQVPADMLHAKFTFMLCSNNLKAFVLSMSSCIILFGSQINDQQ
jgi:hypothetical protein